MNVLGTPADPAPAEGERHDLTLRRYLLVLAAAIVAVFPKVAIGSSTFFYRDFGAMWYPVAMYNRASIFQGELPLWNPYIHCGVPNLAQMGQWYPPDYLSWLVPPPWGTNLFMLLHLFLGGWGAYWLMRRWATGTFGAAFAGLAYVFNGVTLSCLLWTNCIASLAWLPWVIGCVVEAWRHGGRWIVCAAVVSALQVLTGTPEITLLGWMFIGGLWLQEIFAGQTQLVASAGRLAAAVTLAAALTMIQMLPFLDLVAHSQRNQNTATDVWSVPLWGWANLIVPLFHCYQAPQGPWFQTGQELLASYYLGAGILVLAFATVAVVRTPRSGLVLGAAIVCWILALGPHGYVYDWVRRIFPPLGIARFPVKFTILPALLVPMLAGWTADRIVAATAGPEAMGRVSRRTWTAIVVLPLLCMAVLLWIARQHPLPNDKWSDVATNTSVRALLMLGLLAGLWWVGHLPVGRNRLCAQIALLALIPIDALTHSPNIAPTLPSTSLASGVWEATGKPAPPKPGAGRIMISPEAEQMLVYSRVPSLELDFAGKRLAEWYNLNLLDRVPKVTGALPLRTLHADMLERYLYYTSGARFGPGLLDFLSVAWVSDPESPVRWVARTNYLPCVTCGQQPVFLPDDRALQYITAPEFDPRKFVCLPETARGSAMDAAGQTNSSVRDVRFTPHRVSGVVESSTAAMLVVNQTHYHLWRATVDGQPVPLIRANLAFQAIPVPAGTHLFEIAYRDRNLAIGAVITVLAIALCAWLWHKFRPRSPTSATSVPS